MFARAASQKRQVLQSKFTRAMKRLVAVTSALALGTAYTVIPAQPAAAAEIPSSGAYLTFTKQAGLLQPDGSCQMGTSLDSAGFLWAPPGGQICYVLTATNQGPETANGVQLTDTFYAATVPGTQQPILTGVDTPTLTIDGKPVPNLCTGSMQQAWFACGVANAANNWQYTNLTLAPGSTATMQINGTINPLMPNSFSHDQVQWCQFQQAFNQAGQAFPADGQDPCTHGWVYGQSYVDGAWLTNTGSVTSWNNTNNSNSTAQQSIGIGHTQAPPTADVKVTKTGPATAPPGQAIQWVVTASNNGPSDAQNVQVTDNVPAGVKLTAAPGCTLPAGVTLPTEGPLTVTCPLGNLQANTTGGTTGQSASATLTGIVDATFSGTLTNNASVTSDTPDPNNANNTTSFSSNVPIIHDLAVQKTANRTELPSSAGLNVDYNLTVTNNGASPAKNVNITEPIPAGLSYTGYSVSPAGAASCTYDDATSTLNCLAPSVSADPTHPVVVTVNTTSDGDLAAAGNPVSNTVSVSSPQDETDPNMDNNSSTWTLAGSPVADSYITKTMPPTINAGQSGTITFNVGVNPSDDAGVVVISPLVTDQLPTGVTFAGGATVAPVNTPSGISYTLKGGDCTTDPTSLGITNSTLPKGTLYCEIAQNMAQGDEVAITVPVNFSPSLTQASSVNNSATVQNTSDGFVPGQVGPGSLKEQNTGNNTVIVQSIPVKAVVDLSAAMTITDAPSPGVDCDGNPTDPNYTGPGSTRDVQLTIANNGPADAVNSSFTIVPSTGAVMDVSKMLVNGQPASQFGLACTKLSGSVPCSFSNATIPPGGSLVITYPITVPSNAIVGTTTDTMAVHTQAGGAIDDNPDNDNADSPITVGAAVTNLCIAKSAVKTTPNPGENSINGHASFIAGNNFSYNITVAPPTGGVSADAANVTVTDTLPVGLIPASATSNAGDCAISGPVTGTTTDADGNTATGPQYSVTCQLPQGGGNNDGTQNNPAGVINVFGSVDANAVNAYYTPNVANGWNWAEQVPNTANLSYNAPGSAVTQTATATARVDLAQPLPNLVVTKTATGTLADDATPPNQFANPGDSVSWQISATNVNATPALSTVITDAVPAGVIVTGVSGGTCAATNPSDGTTVTLPAAGPLTLTCQVGTLGQNSSANITVTGTVASDLSGATQIDNTAAAGSNTPDADPSNNQAAARITVLPVADTYVTKTAPDTADPGATDLEWQVLAGNYGPSTANGAIVADQVPAGATVTAATLPDGAAANCTPLPLTGPGTLTCTLGDLGTGAQTTITLTATVDPTFSGTLSNSASITSSTPEMPDGADNSASANTQVNALADVWVTQTSPTDDDGNPATIIAGQTVSWNLLAGNYGTNATLDDAVVTSQIPDGVTVTSAPGCTQGDGTDASSLTCAAGSLAPGDTAAFTVTGTVAPDYTTTVGDSVTSTATISSPSITSAAVSDAVPSNNSATVTNPVAAQADVWVAVAGPDANVPAGDQVQFNVTVGNAGPSDAENVVVTNTLPTDNLSNITVNGSDTDSDSSTINVGTLPANTQQTYSVTATINPDTVPGFSVADSASVTTSTPTVPGSSDNDATGAAVTTTQQSELVVGIAATSEAQAATEATEDDDAVPGGAMQYAVVVANNGPSNITAATASFSLAAAIPGSLDTSNIQYAQNDTPVSLDELLAQLSSLGAGSQVEFTATGVMVTATLSEAVDDAVYYDTTAVVATNVPTIIPATVSVATRVVQTTTVPPTAMGEQVLSAPIVPGGVSNLAPAPAPSAPAPVTPPAAPTQPPAAVEKLAPVKVTPVAMVPVAHPVVLPQPLPAFEAGRNAKRPLVLPQPLPKRLTATGLDSSKAWLAAVVTSLGIGAIFATNTGRKRSA